MFDMVDALPKHKRLKPSSFYGAAVMKEKVTELWSLIFALRVMGISN
jgi:hypothetical protein